MPNTSSKDIYWSPSMLTGVQFIFKNKAVIVPDLPPRFTSVQNSKRIYEFSFEFERKILKDLEATEELERQKMKEQMEAKSAFKIGKQDPNELPIYVAPQLTTIEPSRTETPLTEPHVIPKPTSKIDRTLLEDFEFQALRDDPFVAAELSTINDLEELRDVLTSMQMTEPMNIKTKNASLCKSLRNISFPLLSLDDNCVDAIASSAPSSQLSFPTQPSQACDLSAPTSVNTEKAIKTSPSDGSPSRTGASPTKFDLGSVATKSEEQSVADHQSHSDKSDTEILCSIPLQDNKVKSFLSSSPQNVTHIPIPMKNEMKSDHREPEPPTEHVDECQADDPPIVCRLVKMGFKRSRVLALHKVAEQNEEKSDDSMICQLCNWNDLEDKGLEEDVCLAAVTYAPNDLEKATKFGTMVSELLEMGFPLNSVVSAVCASNMIKEKAVIHLLDPSGSSSAVPQVQHQGPPPIPAQGVGWRGKKKNKKSHIYLHAKH